MTVWTPTPAELDVARERTNKLRMSAAPQWADVRVRLGDAGVPVQDAVTAQMVSAGRYSMSGVIVSRDERVFHFNVIFDYDREGHRLPKGHGWIGKWREIGQEEIQLTEAGVPNSWLQAVIVAREVFARERAG